jgi:hypothetical protein
MENNRIRQATDEISFRLLATKNHEDYDWLLTKINDIVLTATVGDIIKDHE